MGQGSDSNSTRSLILDKIIKILSLVVKIIGGVTGLVVLINDILKFLQVTNGIKLYVPLLWRIPYLTTIPSLWRLFP